MIWHQQTINPTERADVVPYAPEHILKLVSNRFAKCFVVVIVVLPVQIHSMLRRLQLISRMAVIQTVTMTLLTYDND